MTKHWRLRVLAAATAVAAALLLAAPALAGTNRLYW